MRVIVAVSIVPAGKVEGDPDHVTVPVNCGSDVMTVTGVAPVTGTVTPAIAEFVIVAALTVTTYVAKVGDPKVAVYVPGVDPASSESRKFPVEFVNVTVCGVEEFTVDPEIVVFVSAVRVHVPPLTDSVFEGFPPVAPDRVNEN